MRGLKGRDGAAAERLIVGIEEFHQHLRARETFREEVSAAERRRRYATRLEEWGEMVKRVA